MTDPTDQTEPDSPVRAPSPRDNETPHKVQEHTAAAEASAPSDKTDAQEPHDAVVGRVLDEFFDRRSSGEEVRTEDLLSDHPEQAERLSKYLHGAELVERAFHRIRGTMDSAEGEPPPATAQVPVVHGYDIVEEIGRGGMGVVYKALQKSTRRIVALKALLSGPVATGSARDRFEREIDLAAALRHRHIVTIYDSGLTQGRYYYVMEYIEGRTLERYVQEERPSLERALGLFSQICDAVHYAHQHGVIHRDLKPGNILIDSQGDPHLLDFGLAKAVRQDDQAFGPVTPVSSIGQIIGTLPYLSPEQVRGRSEDVDTRSDVYSLGVMLYEMLTGRLPYSLGGRPAEAVRQILEAAPAPPSTVTMSNGERRYRWGADLNAVMLRTLAKSPDERYPSAAALGADLRHYLAGEPIEPKRDRPLYVAVKLISRRRRLVSAVAAVALLIAGSLFVPAYLAARSEKQRYIAERHQARVAAIRAQHLLENGQTEGALSSALAVMRAFPELDEGNLICANAYLLSGPYRAWGIEPLQGLLEKTPNRWALHAMLARLYRAIGDAAQATAHQREADRLFPEDAEAYYVRSFVDVDTSAALLACEKALSLAPDHRLALRRHMDLSRSAGQLPSALRDVDRMIALSPDEPDFRISRAEINMLLGRHDVAVQDYTRAVELGTVKPDWVYAARAQAYRRMRDYDKAVEDYTRAIGLSEGRPAWSWHYYQRATPRWILGDLEGALEDYRQFRALHPAPFYADARAFLILHEQGKPAEAERLLSASRRKNPDAWIANVLATLAGELPPEQLIAGADNAEQTCEAYYYAGERCLLTGDQDDARSWFAKCVGTGLVFDTDTFALMNEYELAEWRLRKLPTRGP